MKITELTPEQVRMIAPLIPSTAGALRHIVAGRRAPSAQMAIQIEVAAKRVGIDLFREEMAEGCQMCGFARTCRKLEKQKR